jgi:hypothetical protein
MGIRGSEEGLPTEALPAKLHGGRVIAKLGGKGKSECGSGVELRCGAEATPFVGVGTGVVVIEGIPVIIITPILLLLH